jgi:thymidine kinase
MSITLIVGCMFAGKSTKLHKRYKKTYLKYPDKTICLVPSIDTRYTKTPLSVSHDGSQIYAKHVTSLETDPTGIENAQYIFIDEGQFLKGLSDFCIRQKRAGKDVTIAALNSDCLGNAWPEIDALVPVHVSSYIALTAVCVVCRKDAFYSRKLKSSAGVKDIIDVGGSEKYVPVCLQHFEDTEPIPASVLEKHKNDLNKLIVV